MSKKPEMTEYGTSARLQKLLKEAIEDQGVTKVRFAQNVGVSTSVIIRATVYQSVPGVKSLIKLADYLNVPIMYLFDETYGAEFNPACHPSDFFSRLASLTEEKGVKYSALSHTMSFAPNAVYEWLRTKSIPSPDYLLQLAEYFGVSVDYLLGRTDDKN